MNAWLDAQADGIAFMLVMGLIGIAVLLIAAVVEKVHQTRRHRITRIDGVDVARCERPGSQGENMRRIRTAVGR